jgi:hypothetical protein
VDTDTLLKTVGARRGWLKVLEPIDAADSVRWEPDGAPMHLRFASRPNDVRVGHLVFCVDPEQLVIFAVAKILEDGDTALHDVKATSTARWLFKLPVRVLVVAGDRARAPHLRVAGGDGRRFSYRLLPGVQAQRVTAALVAAL